MDRLKSCMMDFSVQSLKTYLGENLVDTLIEWTPVTEPLVTKSQYADMILTIHGVGMFKNREFRKKLLEKVSREEILGLRIPLQTDETELEILIERASGVAWNDNAVSRYVLNLFDIDPQILVRVEAEEVMEESLDNDERFFELLDYQFYIKQRLLNFLHNEEEQLKRILVQMPTGTGKTKTAMHTIVNYFSFSLEKKGLVIWMAHTTELLEQAYETLKNVWGHLGNGAVKVYRIWGNADVSAFPEEMNGFAFCGISKLNVMQKSSSEQFQKLVNNCRLVVFDEAHKAAATETRKTVLKFMEYINQDRTLIGLTATPGRTTEDTFDNQLLSNMFDNRLLGIDLETVYQMNMSKLHVQNTEIEKNIIQYFQNQHVLARIYKEELTYQQNFTEQELREIKIARTVNGYSDFSKKALETIGRNKSRNLAIMDRLRKIHDNGMVTIVFTCSVEQAKLLSAMLMLEKIPNALVIGEMDSEERRRAIQAFKDKNNDINIIINYEVLTTGFDATNINCVFIARPTQSVVLYSQMLGRGLRGRKMGGNDECLLIDVKDNLEKYNEKMAFTHFENYWKA